MDVSIHPTDNHDRLSDLIDDILLSILGRLDIITAARTSVLSNRWKHLPWLLPQLELDVKDFLCAQCPQPAEAQHMHQAMASLTKAIRSFLANPLSKCTLKRLSIELYMVDDHWHDIGNLVCDAIDNGVLTELDLTFIDDRGLLDVKDGDMRQQARVVNGLFVVCPSMLHCLTELCLTHVRFAECDMHHLLFDCCKQLQRLILDNCDNGEDSSWLIKAPNSKLEVLEIYQTSFGRLDILCLPKLEQFLWTNWNYSGAPLCFGSIPSLEAMVLSCASTIFQQEFSLSEVLHGTPNIHTLILDFQGSKIWMRPEGKQQLSTAFSKLRELKIYGIYVEFDLLWTMVLLEAAPSVEILRVEIWDHPCDINVEGRMLALGYPIKKPFWKVPRSTGSNNCRLKELEFTGFRPLQQQMKFLRAVMKRTPNLRTVFLKEKESCEKCEAMDKLPPPAGGMFPINKYEQETIARQLRYRVSSSANVIFDS